MLFATGKNTWNAIWHRKKPQEFNLAHEKAALNGFATGKNMYRISFTTGKRPQGM